MQAKFRIKPNGLSEHSKINTIATLHFYFAKMVNSLKSAVKFVCPTSATQAHTILPNHNSETKVGKLSKLNIVGNITQKNVNA